MCSELRPVMGDTLTKEEHNTTYVDTQVPQGRSKGSPQSVQFSRSVVFNSLRPHGLQHARLPYPSLIPGACSNSCPSSWWCHPTISPSIILFSIPLQSFPASGSFLPESVLRIRWPKYWEFQLQHQSFQWTLRTDFLKRNLKVHLKDALVGSPCSPMDSQESSPTPQLKSINSWVLSFLYGPTLTSIHD